MFLIHYCVAGSSNITSLDPPRDPELVSAEWGVCECNQTMQVTLTSPTSPHPTSPYLTSCCNSQSDSIPCS